MPDLISQLRRAPQSFNLFQAISLLERGAPERAPVGGGLGMDEAVRLAAQVDMAFAPSDIASLADSDRPGPELTLRTAALSLAGAQGPLAAPFTDMLLARRRLRDSAGLDFLDMFNQRLLGFWYRARAKHHLALQSNGPMPLPRSLDALSGLGRAEGAHGPAGELAWLRHAGLQGAAPRSMATLLAILRDRTGVAFDGEQFVGHWHALAARDQARLQSRRPQALGMGASLGARAWDQAAGMALTAPPLAPQDFAALLPTGPRFALVGWLVARHLQRDITVTLALELKAAPATRLAGRLAQPLPPRLGHSAWLGSRTDAARPPAIYQRARFVLAAERN
ncbi:MAG TPA: type VI secretion system baseplate subunit TssG [Telluria sp.]|jgi:type VI secretion system protein ImpH